jgi:hypothetical protein
MLRCEIGELRTAAPHAGRLGESQIAVSKALGLWDAAATGSVRLGRPVVFYEVPAADLAKLLDHRVGGWWPLWIGSNGACVGVEVGWRSAIGMLRWARERS